MESFAEKKEKYSNFLEEYLELKGVNTKKLIKCFSKEHEDKNPSMSFYKKNNSCHCFACGIKYDIFKLVGQEYNLTDFKEQFKKVEELYNNRDLIKNINEGIYSQKGGTVELNTVLPEKKKINKKGSPYSFSNEYDYRKYIYECREKNKTLDNTYLEKRGISKEIQNHFNIGYDDNFKIYGVKNAVIIPTDMYSFTARNTEETDSKNKVRKVGHNGFFGIWEIKKKDTVFITEGEIDALSLYQIGEKAISLGGVANTKSLVKKLLEKEIKDSTYILMLDNDSKGKEAQKELYELMKKENIEVYNSKSLEKYGYKDPNEFLVKNKKEFENVIEKMVKFIIEKNNKIQTGWGARASQKSGLGHGE